MWSLALAFTLNKVDYFIVNIILVRDLDDSGAFTHNISLFHPASGRNVISYCLPFLILDNHVFPSLVENSFHSL